MSLLSRGNAPSGGSPWGWYVLVLGILAALLWSCSMLSGCATTREESHHEATEVSRRFALKGSVSVPVARSSDGAPMFVPVAVDLVLDGGGIDETTGEAKARTQLEAPEVAGAVVAGLKMAFPALAFLGTGQPQMGPAPSGWSNTDTGLATTTALAIATMLQRHNAAKNATAERNAETVRAEAERKRADEHKADAAEGWAHATARKGGA